MPRIVLILYTLVCLASVASAEVYKWEDANGVHLTDNASSVPEKYREKVYAETSEQIRATTPKVGTGISKLNITPVLNQINQVGAYQATLEQQRQSSEAMRQQQVRSLAASTRNLDNALQPLARFMAIWLMVGFFIFISWVATIIDIVRSEFVTPSNKTVWMLLVLFLPLLGMLLYYLFGLSQKCKSISYEDKHQAELLARLKPRDPKDKDFIF
ncbi:MAG: DUF4124 domain-containing protein [Desulfuromonadaceae bacterium]|nr:DUF4124 domain-containing protein [Desulfuromonadaceae bacterium]MDD2847629.1 DUF4124 domain-containing protein [Desulfuromonadaceae bacterium]MDD4131125.1 DUF4124 domain-containing protein [Desulfuromonadaceae bacterium]